MAIIGLLKKTKYSVMKTHYLFLFLLILLTSCSSSDDENPLFTNGNFLSADIDNDRFEAIDASVSVIFSENSSGFGLVIAGSRGDILSGETTFEALEIGAFFTDRSEFAAGMEWRSSAMDIIANPLGAYQGISSDQSVINATSEGNNNTVLRITSLDEENQIISGEFSFTATDDDITLQITNGVFTNVPYQIN